MVGEIQRNSSETIKSVSNGVKDMKHERKIRVDDALSAEPKPKPLLCDKCGRGGGTLRKTEKGRLVHNVCGFSDRGKTIPIEKIPDRKSRRLYKKAQRKKNRKDAVKLGRL